MFTLAKVQFNDAVSASRARRRWAAFGVASLVVHILLLLEYGNTQPDLPAQTKGAQLISISLAPLREQPVTSRVHAAQPEHVEPSAQRRLTDKSSAQTPPLLLSTASPQPKREPQTSVAPKAVAQETLPEPVETKSDAAITQQESTQQTITIAQASESHAQQEQAQRNYLLSKVRSLLRQHFTYPLRARQRGWEGEVLLGFQVDENGRLGNVHLARSSGYSLLDRSALAALVQVKDIPLFDSHPISPMELQLPVLYQLREG